MYRFARKQVEKWITARRRKPLIVRGARQIGKTWLVEHAAASKFEAVVKIDLEKRRHSAHQKGAISVRQDWAIVHTCELAYHEHNGLSFPSSYIFWNGQF